MRFLLLAFQICNLLFLPVASIFSPVHKIALQLGPLTLTWYGIFVALGFLIGIWTASRRGLREGIAPEKIIDIGPWLLIGAIVGARTLYVVSYWNEAFAGKPFWEVFKIYQGGIVYYGGL